MALQEAIKLALKNGWKENWYLSHFSGDEVIFGDTRQFDENNPCYYKNVYQILLDREFWMAFGKGLGYKSNYTKDDPEWRTMTIGEMEERTPLALCCRMIIHLFAGDDIESFFSQLK